MNLQVLKWLAVTVPAVLVAIFEYVRHNYLLDILHMDTGNWVTAGLALVTGFPLVASIFRTLDRVQAELEKERRRLAVLEERDRIARELHDGICQALFYANVQLKAAEDCLRRGDREGCAAALAEGRAAVQASHDDVRQAVFNLKTAQPPERSLADTVAGYVEEFQRQTGLHVRCDVAALARFPVYPDEGGNLLKILQEALWNVRKHARANTVEVDARFKEGWLEVMVRDDGQGFDAVGMRRNGRGRFGMRIMRERAALLGGELQVSSAPGRGTEVLLRVPAGARGGVCSA